MFYKFQALQMNKSYRLNWNVLLGLICLLSFSDSLKGQSSQDNSDSSGQKKVLLPSETEPGPLLTIPKSRSVTSYSTVTGSELNKITVPNLSNTLYGQLSGLMVMQGSGEPGGDGARLLNRGLATYDASEVLCFIDGFQVNYAVNFQYLLPSEIESITLLKDPVTLATFGMRGANRVLWVTTKRAKAGKPTIFAQVVSGVQQAININKPFGSYDYARLYNQAISNDNYSLNGNRFVWSPFYSDAQLTAYQNGTGTNVDWYEEALRKNGSYTDANISINGGNEVASYNVLLDYMNQGGLFDVPNTEVTSNARIQRLNVRSNFDIKFMKIFQASMDLGGRIESRSYPNNGIGSYRFFDEILSRYPSNIYPVKDQVTGNWSGTTLYRNNPVAELNARGLYTTHDRTLLANFKLKEDLGFITPGLYLSQAVSFNTWTRTNQGKFGEYTRFYNGQQSTSDLGEVISYGDNNPEAQLTWRQANITAGYDRTSGEHAFSGALNFYSSDMVPDAGEDASKLFYHFLNYGGRFNYAYKSRYIIDLGFGYSGSDNFATGNHWGFYPAVAAGWIASNESFLKESKVLTLLKLRAAIGTTGNETQAGRYAYQQYYRGTGGVITGDASLTSNSGIQLGRIATPGIFAEKSTKYNVGVDFTLINKISVTTDFFIDKRTGIIGINNFVPGYLGYTDRLPLDNIGRMTNKGVELNAVYTDKAGDVTYQVGAMVTYAKNKIDYQSEIPNKNSFSNTTGLPLGTPIGLISDGFYQLEDFNADGTLKQGIPIPLFGPVQPGDLKYKDLDNNNIIDNDDRTKIGNPLYPSLYYSFNLQVGYKGFDLSVLFQGASGMSSNLIGASYNQVVPFINNIYTVYPIAGNAWAYYPDQNIDTRNTADFPRISTVANENNYRSSTFWMKDAGFLRMRNIMLGYTLPDNVVRKMRLDKLRLFVTAVNPFTISRLLQDYNMDPETPVGYPAIKSYNAGISITF